MKANNHSCSVTISLLLSEVGFGVFLLMNNFVYKNTSKPTIILVLSLTHSFEWGVGWEFTAPRNNQSNSPPLNHTCSTNMGFIDFNFTNARVASNSIQSTNNICKTYQLINISQVKYSHQFKITHSEKYNETTFNLTKPFQLKRMYSFFD